VVCPFRAGQAGLLLINITMYEIFRAQRNLTRPKRTKCNIRHIKVYQFHYNPRTVIRIGFHSLINIQLGASNIKPTDYRLPLPTLVQILRRGPQRLLRPGTRTPLGWLCVFPGEGARSCLRIPHRTQYS
jgi:hypothetical protein